VLRAQLFFYLGASGGEEQRRAGAAHLGVEFRANSYLMEQVGVKEKNIP
jgi:hypothetical protein